MPRKHIAFGWYGGKYSHLDWLLPLLPSCHHYCEPFGGSAAVLINREPSPVETYNDVDSEVVNFFRVLRHQPDELVRQIGLTPFSREEYALAINSNGSARPDYAAAEMTMQTDAHQVELAEARNGSNYAVVRIYDQADVDEGGLLSDLERAHRFFVRA